MDTLYLPLKYLLTCKKISCLAEAKKTLYLVVFLGKVDPQTMSEILVF